MKLQIVPQLRAEDYPSEKEWIPRLFQQINPFFQQISQIFDNNVDYTTNVKSITRSYDITTFQEFSFLWPFKGFTPISLSVTRALKGADQTPTILMAAWSYDKSTGSITISRMVEILTTSVAELDGRYIFDIRATV